MTPPMKSTTPWISWTTTTRLDQHCREVTHWIVNKGGPSSPPSSLLPEIHGPHRNPCAGSRVHSGTLRNLRVGMEIKMKLMLLSAASAVVLGATSMAGCGSKEADDSRLAEQAEGAEAAEQANEDALARSADATIAPEPMSGDDASGSMLDSPVGSITAGQPVASQDLDMPDQGRVAMATTGAGASLLAIRNKSELELAATAAFMQFDADKNGAIDKLEYAAMANDKAVMDARQGASLPAEAPKPGFEGAAGAASSISKSEFATVLAARFDHADADNNGTLSDSERVVFLRTIAQPANS